MPDVEISREAEADLLSIARYTVKKWGKSQAIVYEEKLRTAFAAIGNGTVRSRILFPDWPELHVVRCEHHYLFFLTRHLKAPFIVAVLHEKMELTAHLRKRLTDD